MDNSGNQQARAYSFRHRLMISPRFLSVLGGSVLGIASVAAASPESRPQRVSLAYFGERAVQPGLRLGYDAAAWLRRPHELLIGGNVAAFAVPSGYGLMALLEGGYRVTPRFGGFLDLRVGLGYTAAWVSSGGPDTVSNYLTLSALGGIGYDFFRLLRAPISVMARSGVLWRYGMPHGPVAGPIEGASYVLDVGLAYQFGTGRPKPIALPFDLPPPAEAPANLDDPGTTVPTPGPIAPADSAAATPTPVPAFPLAPTPAPAQPTAPDLRAPR